MYIWQPFVCLFVEQVHTSPVQHTRLVGTCVGVVGLPWPVVACVGLVCCSALVCVGLRWPVLAYVGLLCSALFGPWARCSALLCSYNNVYIYIYIMFLLMLYERCFIFISIRVLLYFYNCSSCDQSQPFWLKPFSVELRISLGEFG